MNTPAAGEITYKDVWQLPFEDWGGSAAYSTNHHMAFMPTQDGVLEETIAILNGESDKRVQQKLEWSGGSTTIYAVNERGIKRPYLIVRGWGTLTGPGGYHLLPETAAKIQDDFAAWIIETLTTPVNK